jgi:hypothetical protein
MATRNPPPQQLWQQEMQAQRKEQDQTIRGSLPYKLQKELLIVLVAPEILSELKALAKQRKQSLDELVEKIIEAYLAGQLEIGRGLTENPEDLRNFLKLAAPGHLSSTDDQGGE